MNGYVFFYNGKRIELYANTIQEAQQRAVAIFRPPKSKQHMVHGMLAEKADEPVVHSPGELQ